MKRTFFAVAISDELKRIINSISEDIPELKRNVRLVSPHNAHITVKFLGPTKEDIIPEVMDTVGKEITGFKKFEFISKETGVFPKVSYPRVLWIGTSQGGEQLKSISEIINNSLANLGFPKETREFRSHVTIGRVRKTHKKVDGLERFLSYNFAPVKTIVDRLVFFESTLTPEGAIYKAIKVFIF